VLPHEIKRLLEPHQQILGVARVLSRRGHGSDEGRMPGMAFLGFDYMLIGTFKINLVKCVHSVLGQSKLLSGRPSLFGRGITLTGVWVVRC
jgi:hypothetical protein